MKKSVKQRCVNIFECGMAARFHHAQSIPEGQFRCGLCHSDELVLEIEADWLLRACKVCSLLSCKRYEQHDTTTECLHKSLSHCPFCHLQYQLFAEDETSNIRESKEGQNAMVDKGKMDEKKGGKHSKIDQNEDAKSKFFPEDYCALLSCFVGSPSLEYSRFEIKKLAVEKGCEDLCKLIKALFQNMDDGEKKDHLRSQILETIRPLRILKDHCSQLYDELECCCNTPNRCRHAEQ